MAEREKEETLANHPCTLILLLRPLIILLPLMLASCGFINREVYLKNSEPAPLTPTKAHAICFAGFGDARKDSTIGKLVNLMGQQVSEVIALNNVQTWVNNEVRNRLIAAGYSVFSSCDGHPGAVSLTGSTNKVYTIAAYGKYTADVAFECGIGGKTTRTYTGYFDGGSIGFSPTAESFGKTLRGALEDAVGKLVASVDSFDVAEPADTGKIVAAAKPTTDSIIDSARSLQLDEGVLILSGNRPKPSVDSAIDPVKSELKSMFSNRMELAHLKSGSITVRFTINPDGKTGNISFIQNTLGDQPIQEKLIERIGTLQFPPTENGSVTQAAYKINFNAEAVHNTRAGFGALAAILIIVPLVVAVAVFAGAMSK